MADDVVAARREARRRRILENSQSRLRKITGQPEEISNGIGNGLLTLKHDESETDQWNGLPFETSISANITDANFVQDTLNYTKNSLTNTNIAHENVEDTFDYPRKCMEEICKQGNSSFHNALGNSSFTQPIEERIQDQDATESNSKYVDFIFSTRLHLVVLAVIVKLLLMVQYGFLFGESVFAPLTTVEVADIIARQFHRNKTQPPGLLGAALILSGIKHHNISRITSCISVLERLCVDIAIYFFSFVMIHSAMDWLG